MEPRILVTGATGTVGSRVTRLLCERGVPVIAAVRSLDREPLVRAHCAEVRVADFGGDLDELFTDVDKVFLITPDTPDEVEIGDRLIAQAHDAGVDHVVKLSIIGADDAAPGLLQRWHRHMERMIEGSGMRFTFLRPTVFMQNFLGTWGWAIRPDGRIYLPGGDSPVSYIDARDVAAAGVETLLRDGHAGKAYTLTGEVALTHTEIAGIFARALERRVEYVDIPEDLARTSLEGAGVEEPMITGVLQIWRLQKAGRVAAVTDVVQDILGRPPVSFSQFVRDHAPSWGADQAAAVGEAGLDG